MCIRDRGYDNRLTNLIEAGCDLYLMPSLYEPCGLNQIYSLRYGTLPIVRKVGGLKDTVADYRNAKDHGNGFMFQEPTEEALIQVMRKALQTFQSHPKIFNKMISDAMNQSFSGKTQQSHIRSFILRLFPVRHLNVQDSK